jgi:hypothetical protein
MDYGIPIEALRHRMSKATEARKPSESGAAFPLKRSPDQKQTNG